MERCRKCGGGVWKCVWGMGRCSKVCLGYAGEKRGKCVGVGGL